MVLFIKKRFIILSLIIICFICVALGMKIYLKKENKILIGGSLAIVECIIE